MSRGNERAGAARDRFTLRPAGRCQWWLSSATPLRTTSALTRARPKVRLRTLGFSRYSRRMADAVQGGTLAGSHEGKPGLPRGRSRLPARAVLASQRERLLRAAVGAVAASGYATVTVADIVRHAKVSRAAFYAHFSGKEDCFLDGDPPGRADDGRAGCWPPPARCRRAPGRGRAARGLPRVPARFLADEPAFARVFYIDMPAAGPVAVERLYAASGAVRRDQPRLVRPGASPPPGLAGRSPFDAYLGARRGHRGAGAVQGPRRPHQRHCRN